MWIVSFVISIVIYVNNCFINDLPATTNSLRFIVLTDSELLAAPHKNNINGRFYYTIQCAGFDFLITN
jgi:hypothetical protein